MTADLQLSDLASRQTSKSLSLMARLQNGECLEQPDLGILECLSGIGMYKALVDVVMWFSGNASTRSTEAPDRAYIGQLKRKK